MANYGTHFNLRRTPQTQPVPHRTMVENNAGGFVFQISKWDHLMRFLILGCEGNSYYASEKTLTKDNAKNLLACLKEDGLRVVRTIVEVSDSGRAIKNDPALFALAIASADENLQVRKAALDALPKVARIGTHLFHFVSYVENFRGWGRSLKNAIANWYNSQLEDNLALQVIKYQQRDGWSHADLLRLAHPKTNNNVTNAIYRYVHKKSLDINGRNNVVNKDGEVVRSYQGYPAELLPDIIHGFEAAKAAQTPKEIVKLIEKYDLPRECIPTQFLNERIVWEQLLKKMPMTAMIRNLGKMSSVGLFNDSENVSHVVKMFSNESIIKKARIHPFSVLLAMAVYEQGHGDKGKLSWTANTKIIDSLDKMFYTSFGNVEPTGKRICLALDVSGSMGSRLNNTCITARQATAAMSLVTAAVESEYAIMGFSHKFVPLTISPRQRLDDVVKNVSRIDFGSTDCALPMQWARSQKIKFDAFVVYTDNETYHGDIHPFQALKQYRQHSGINAKLIVVGMTATKFSIADPSDAGMLDVVGFDANCPQIISDFIKS